MKKHYVLRTEEEKNNFASVLFNTRLKAPVVVDIDLFYKSRTGNQLRAYWRLIKVCKNFMNSFGNNFDDETVSDYFKLKSGHYTELNGVKLPKSIANNSGTTTEDMKKIIDTILEFGLDNNIDGCEICSDELKSLLEYYENYEK